MELKSNKIILINKISLKDQFTSIKKTKVFTKLEILI